MVDDALVMAILNINNNIKYYLGSKQYALLLFSPITNWTWTRVFTYFYQLKPELLLRHNSQLWQMTLNCVTTCHQRRNQIGFVLGSCSRRWGQPNSSPHFWMATMHLLICTVFSANAPWCMPACVKNHHSFTPQRGSCLAGKAMKSNHATHS